VEPGEAIAGKQRPVDFLLTVLPSAPARNRRQKRLELLAFELVANHLLVARTGPDGVPLRFGRGSGVGIRDSNRIDRAHVLVMPANPEPRTPNPVTGKCRRPAA